MREASTHVILADCWLLPREQTHYRGAQAAVGSQSPTILGTALHSAGELRTCQQHPLPGEVLPGLSWVHHIRNLGRDACLEVLPCELSGDIRLLLKLNPFPPH